MAALREGWGSFGCPFMVLAVAVGSFCCSTFEQRCYRRASGTADAAVGSASYYWPTSVGHTGNHSRSPHAGPRNLSAAYSWSWQHYFGRFRTPGLGGTVLDDKRNIYLSANSEVIKFSPDGTILWRHSPQKHCFTPDSLAGFQLIMNSPSLWGGALYATTESGAVFALSMETGQELWSRQFVRPTSLPTVMATNNGFVQVHDGVLVTDSLTKVYAFSAVDGAPLWEFQTDAPVWNFMAAFPGDGTVVFQDFEGRAYRCGLRSGELLWKAGGVKGTWTDGGATVGPNGIVYAVHTYGFMGGLSPGELQAFALADGRPLWKRHVNTPPNNMPAVGRLFGGTRLSVVQPTGQQDVQGQQHHVRAFDAESGEPVWVFEGPTQLGRRQASSDLPPEQQASLHVACIPNPWSAPTIDATGTVYIANQEGQVFALRDANGDGRVEGEGEVFSYETRRGFCGSEAPSLAPGLLAIASCDSLFVFRWPENETFTA